jgi:hypothetical protein
VWLSFSCTLSCICLACTNICCILSKSTAAPRLPRVSRLNQSGCHSERSQESAVFQNVLGFVIAFS